MSVADPSPTPPRSGEGRQTGSPPSRFGKGVGGLGRRRLLLVVPVVILLAGVGVWYAFLRGSGPKDDLGRFQGEWQVTFAGVETRSAPAVLIRVEGDRWTYASPMQQSDARIVLNPVADPKEIDLIRLDADGQPWIYTRGEKTEVRQQGVYAFDGDTIRVALSPYPDPRPKTLNPADAPVWVLSRVKR